MKAWFEYIVVELYHCNRFCSLLHVCQLEVIVNDTSMAKPVKIQHQSYTGSLIFAVAEERTVLNFDIECTRGPRSYQQVLRIRQDV